MVIKKLIRIFLLEESLKILFKHLSINLSSTKNKEADLLLERLKKQSTLLFKLYDSDDFDLHRDLYTKENNYLCKLEYEFKTKFPQYALIMSAKRKIYVDYCFKNIKPENCKCIFEESETTTAPKIYIIKENNK